MELRVLQYFLAVSREQNISAAAESLHLTQPTLSRQLQDLEKELGKQLFIRTNRKIILTEEGMLLRKRAEEITALVNKTQDEISRSDETATGDIYIGAGETEGVRFLAKAIHALQTDSPLIHTHIISGDRPAVLEQLDRGLIDFGLIFGEIDTSKYELIKIPYHDQFGILMKRDDILANKEVIFPEDLIQIPLIVSRQTILDKNINGILQCTDDQLNIVGTYNLLYNGSLMVAEGIGYALCLDKIINVTGDSNLCFKPLATQMEIEMHLIWKKYQVLTKASRKYLNKLQELALL